VFNGEERAEDAGNFLAAAPHPHRASGGDVSEESHRREQSQRPTESQIRRSRDFNAEKSILGVFCSWSQLNEDSFVLTATSWSPDETTELTGHFEKKWVLLFIQNIA